MSPSHARQGFTLIEVAVVIGIILTLTGLLAPVVQIAGRAAKRTNTLALLGKLDAGLRRFKQDVGVYPYQAYDTVAADYGTIDNRLAYHVARELGPADLADLRVDLAAGRSAYDSGVHRFLKTTPAVVVTQADSVGRPAIAQVLNRMGRERAGLMIQAGHTALTGVGDNAALPIISSGGVSRGWGVDYLGSDLSARNVKGDAVIDSYGNHLLYVCPVICGMKDSWVAPSILDGNTRASLVRADRLGFQAQGRAVTTSMASDLRDTAAGAYAFEFELWSTGPDRRADPQRNAGVNSDNIPAGPYLKGLSQ